MLNATYRHGTSVVHRARPGVKLVALFVVTGAVVVVPTLSMLGGVAVVVTVCALVAGLGPRGLLGLVWPMRWIVLLLTPVQVWTAGPERAVVVVGGLVVAVAAAGVVTATTRVEDMMETITTVLRSFRVVGVDADRVALGMALLIRSIPVLQRTLAECGDARRARGLERSPRAVLVPVVVRTVHHADRVGEALLARGVDD